jgi:hypothetical protein
VIVKAVHLLKSLEQVERDLTELTSIKMTIHADRKYADRLQTSLKEEELRLEELKKRLLSQVVKNPPADIFSKEESLAPAPELTISIKPPKTKIDERKKTNAEVKKQPLKEPDRASFRFKYN